MMLRQMADRLRFAPLWTHGLFAVGLAAAGIVLLIELHNPMSIALIVLAAVFARSAAPYAMHARRRAAHRADEEDAKTTGQTELGQL